MRPHIRVFPSANRPRAFPKQRIPLCAFRVTGSRHARQALERPRHTAQPVGKWPDGTGLLAILASTAGQSGAPVALTRRITPKTVHPWVRLWLVAGRNGLRWKQPPGRPPKLTTTQPHPLAARRDEGPGPAGVASACWRAPLLQPLIHEPLGGYDNVGDSAPWLTPLGCRDQHAPGGAAQRHDDTRQEWCHTPWPQMLPMAHATSAWRLCGDAAACPQWGPLAYPWARRGHPPVVTTAGQRQGDQVFGVLEDCTGRFFDPGQEGRLTAASDSAWRTRVVAQPPHT